jgi:HNH endonuclease
MNLRLLDGHCAKCDQQRRAKWRNENKEKQKALTENWRERNRTRYLENVRRWQKDHPEKHKATQKINGAMRRARLKNAEGTYTTEEWTICKTQHGNVCLRCHRPETERPLSPDHVIPLSKGGTNYISNIQPLCLPCNHFKRNKIIDWR